MQNKIFNLSKIKYWMTVIGFSCLAAYIVNPKSYSVTNIDWMLSGDFAQTLVGWEFFRVSPESIPVTKISNLFPETGFYVVQSDTVPWVSVIVRFFLNLFGNTSSIHFIGLWLVFCWILQGIYAGLFAKQMDLKPDTHFLLIFLFIFSPLLLMRFGHFSLMAHWVVLATLYESLRALKGLSASLFRVVFLILLVVFSIGIHPYLFAISAPIAILALLSYRIPSTYKFFGLSLMIFSAYVSVKLLGFSSVKEVNATDFGVCNTDILGIFNSFKTSLFIPSLRATWCQNEGYTYFGFGFLMLIFFLRKSMFGFIKKTWKRNLFSKCFIVLVVLYILYSLASPIRFGGNPILYIPIYDWIQPLPSIFRSSGRWIWPVYYLIIIVCIYLLNESSVKNRRRIISFLVLFHLIEFIPLYRILNPPLNDSSIEIEQLLKELPIPTQDEKKMHLYPQVVSVGCGIDDKKWESKDWALIMIALARKGWLIDSGLGARFDSSLVEACRKDNKLDPRIQFPLISKVIPNWNVSFSKKEIQPGIYLITDGKK